VRGTVTLDTTGDPIHGAEVWILSLGISAFANVEGIFQFENVPVGSHEVMAIRQHLVASRQVVEVTEGQTADIQITMTLTPVHESITVTASAGETTTFDSFNSIASLDTMDMAERMAPNIGELLGEEAGIYKRSFGPGSSRPIIRGFDGDRVLIMQDGVRTGDLSSQSGDHGVTIDPAGLERLEVVRGPATLLYGSNAIGGVVNAITPHDTFHAAKHVGTDGQALVDFGTANAQAGVNGHVQQMQENWTVWAGGGARRTSDYDTPEGKVENSATRLANGRLGFGFFTDKTYFSGGYQVEDGRYGVPGVGDIHGHDHEEEEIHGEEEEGHDEEEELQIDLDTFRQSARFNFGMKNFENDFVEHLHVAFSYIDWQHDELEVEGANETIGTSFDNKTYVVRAEIEHKQAGPFSGKFGLWTHYRDYKAFGEEALAPPTTQASFAGFVYEELTINPSAKLLLGGRVEYNDYNPELSAEEHEHEDEDHEHEHEEDLEPPEARQRSFTGFSGSVGLRHDLGSSSALVANFTGSTRAPALEELYNFGPHVGNLAFEIGNPDLKKETSLGLDLSLRTQSSRVQGNVSFYYYDINGFVFPAFTDLIVDGLRVAPFLQGDSRFVGIDGEASFQLHKHALLNIDLGYVRATLTETNEDLPRIPPLHGRFAVEVPYGGLTVRPELVWAAQQDKIARNETPTDGYAVFNINASYLLPRQSYAHVFAVRAYNLTNTLYRLHTSFIKLVAPEIGRGIQFTYSIRFF
jgi:iron complex outermembrane receptor protein